MTIHTSDPFATPEDERSPLRRMRGRLPAAVTLWTAYGLDDRPAGLTVSSMVIGEGDPGVLLGLIDEESELYAAAVASGRFTVAPLRDGDAQLADRFAGLLPAPGGLFAEGNWVRSPFGPVRSSLHTWVGCTVTAVAPAGFAMLVQASVDHVQLGSDPPPALLRYRGRYFDGPGPDRAK